MKLSLFVSDYVGYNLSLFFNLNSINIDYLVLDPINKNNYNEKIIHCFEGTKTQIVFYNESFYNNYSDNFKKIDIVFLIWWPYIIDKMFIKLPSIGVINTHPSLLPYNKGKNYNFWTIVEDTPFGVSLHFVDSNIDSGDILFQKKIIKTWEDTGKTIYLKAQKAIIDLFIDSFPKIIAGNYSRIKQNKKSGTFHYGYEMNKVTIINLDQAYITRELINLIRAKTFDPYPSCYFILNGRKYFVTSEIIKNRFPNRTFNRKEVSLNKKYIARDIFEIKKGKPKKKKLFFFKDKMNTYLFNLIISNNGTH